MIDENASSSTHHEHVQAITTLRSGRVVDNKVEEKDDEQIELLKNPNLSNERGVSNGVPSSATSPLETQHEPKAPFPPRLKEPSHFRKQQKKIQGMLEVFKQGKINIPLLDAIQQISSYAKFLKNLCTQ